MINLWKLKKQKSILLFWENVTLWRATSCGCIQILRFAQDDTSGEMLENDTIAEVHSEKHFSTSKNTERHSTHLTIRHYADGAQVKAL